MCSRTHHETHTKQPLDEILNFFSLSTFWLSQVIILVTTTEPSFPKCFLYPTLYSMYFEEINLIYAVTLQGYAI